MNETNYGEQEGKAFVETLVHFALFNHEIETGHEDIFFFVSMTHGHVFLLPFALTAQCS